MSLQSLLFIAALLIILLVIMAIKHIYYYHIKQKISLKKEIITFGFIFYFGVVIALTILPLDFMSSGRMPEVNMVPFKTISEYLTVFKYREGSVSLQLFILNVFGNIILFIPLGFGLAYFLRKKNISHRFVVSISIIILFSLLIELLQFVEVLTGVVYMRSVDIDDVILNTIGGIIGYVICNCIIKKKETSKSAV